MESTKIIEKLCHYKVSTKTWKKKPNETQNVFYSWIKCALTIQCIFYLFKYYNFSLIPLFLLIPRLISKDLKKKENSKKNLHSIAFDDF